MSAYTHLIDSQHAPYVVCFDKPVDAEVLDQTIILDFLSSSDSSEGEDECSISCEDSCPCNEAPSTHISPIAKKDEPISKGSYKDVISNIPKIPKEVINAMKNSTITKIMKNKIISMKDITYLQLQDTEKFKEVIKLLEKKVPLKKSILKVYN
tara:strand:+ start:1401 stop:1859 length:459 start_codon:yes stop_codon:yes gene_type:complete